MYQNMLKGMKEWVFIRFYGPSRLVHSFWGKEVEYYPNRHPFPLSAPPYFSWGWDMLVSKINISDILEF